MSMMSRGVTTGIPSESELIGVRFATLDVINRAPRSLDLTEAKGREVIWEEARRPDVEIHLAGWWRGSLQIEDRVLSPWPSCRTC